MKFLAILTVLLCSTQLVAQDLTCADFKEGEFSIYTDSPLASEGTLIRRGNKQIETYHKIPDEMKNSGFPMEPIQVRIEWIDECTFLLFPGKDKEEYTEADAYIEAQGGVRNEKVKIEGECFYYRSSLKSNNEDIILTGKICKKS